jgi:pimeloyl-ACP methyl ester carboxylesterase
MWNPTLAFCSLILRASLLSAQQIPSAIFTDPPHDAKHPARMEVLHIPSGQVRINGVAYLAAGAGSHPTFVFFHGLPGNEKNLDLAQAVRRAGWNAITVNYRGSWGSPGAFRFAQNIEDGHNVLAFLRDPANAKQLGIDTTRLVIAGHSMGGWVTAHVAAHERGLRGAILISAADMGLMGSGQRADVVKEMADDLESLAGVTPEEMADELIANSAKWKFDETIPGLSSLPLLVLTTDDGLAPPADALVKALRARGNTHVTAEHVATDHSWSDRRISLESRVLDWLKSLGG